MSGPPRKRFTEESMPVEDEPMGAEDEFCETMNEMTKSLSNVREVVQQLLRNPDLGTKDGISLLSLKSHLISSYLQSLTLMSAHRVLGHSLTQRKTPSQPFSDQNRASRGADAGDLVDSVVETCIVLGKVKQLESKMRYQIEKLIKLTEEDSAKTEVDVINDPLAFRPNPENFLDQEETESDTELYQTKDDGGGGVYRPPKLVPMPYIEKKDKHTKRAPVPTGLAALAHLDGSKPHIESSTGLGAMPSMMSKRARDLQEMTQFEEENMTRLVMTKREARRRARDEADVALGGSGLSKGRRRGGGLEDEFAEVLRAVDKGSTGGTGLADGYDALRVHGRKQDVFTRSKTRGRIDDDDEERVKKKPRFQTAVKLMGKRRK